MATVTLIELAFLRSQLGSPHLLGRSTGWLRPVGEKASVVEARKDAPAANAWSHQPLRSLMTVEFLLT
jgi:hypothetical protein